MINKQPFGFKGYLYNINCNYLEKAIYDNNSFLNIILKFSF